MAAPRMSSRRRPLLALIVLMAILLVGYTGKALQTHHNSAGAQSTSASPTVGEQSTDRLKPLSRLPAEARHTVELIEHGGPFPYRHDGIIYNNLERHLPVRPSGYYHEYTVVTAGSPDRGARRIIIGQDGQFYYTSDHYSSFVQVDVNG